MSSETETKDEITEYGDLLRYVYLVVFGAISFCFSVRFNFFGGDAADAGRGGMWLPAIFACMYRRKWRRAAGLPVGPRWSKSHV